MIADYWIEAGERAIFRSAAAEYLQVARQRIVAPPGDVRFAMLTHDVTRTHVRKRVLFYIARAQALDKKPDSRSAAHAELLRKSVAVVLGRLRMMEQSEMRP